MKNLVEIATEIRGLKAKSIILYKGYLFESLEKFIAENNLKLCVNILKIEDQGKWSMTMNQAWLKGATQGDSKIYVFAQSVADISGVLQEELIALYHQGIAYEPIFGDGWHPDTIFCLGKVKLIDGDLVVELIKDKDGFGPLEFTTYDAAFQFSTLCGAGRYQVQKLLKI